MVIFLDFIRTEISPYLASQNTCDSNFKSDKILHKVVFKLILDHARICVANKTFWWASFRPLGETKLEIKMEKGSVLHIKKFTI